MPMTRCLWSVWALRSSLWTVRKVVLIFCLVGCQDWHFTAEPRSPKTLEKWLCLQIWGGREGPFGDRLHLSVKKPVSEKPQIMEIQELLIQLCGWFPAVRVGHLSEFWIGKTEDGKLICPGENKPTDSDWFWETVRLKRTEDQWHSPEILPTNPVSFQAVQEPPSQREDFGC